MKETPSRKLRELMAREVPIVVPAVSDPLSARLAARAGFECLYLGGGALGYLKGVTEAGLTLTQMVQAGIEIRAAAPLPLILDAACGYGDPMHVRQTVNMCEAAGFAAIEIEDQLIPKRAHHHIGIEHLVPTELMVHKIREAVAARRDGDLVVIARTNACRTDNVDEAVRRAEAYRRAGADMIFALHKTPEQARAIGERLGGPLFYTMLGGIGSIGMSLEELGRLGYRLVCEPITPLFAVHRALRRCYESLAKGIPDPTLMGEHEQEDALVRETVGLETLLDVERRTVER